MFPQAMADGEEKCAMNKVRDGFAVGPQFENDVDMTGNRVDERYQRRENASNHAYARLSAQNVAVIIVVRVLKRASVSACSVAGCAS